MKALRFLTSSCAVALTVAGCAIDSNPTPPTDNNPPPAQQNTTTTTATYNLNLKTGNERPAETISRC